MQNVPEKLHCLGCISKQTMRSVVKKTRLNSLKNDFLMKASLPPKEESWAFYGSFSFHFLSFNGVFLTLKCRTLVLKHLHGNQVAAICLKWISATKVSKYGKSEYSRALNASYTFKPLMIFWYILINNYSLKPRLIVRSLQNFQTWQFTSLSFRKQQRNGLNGTANSLKPEKKSGALLFSVDSPSL